MSTENNMEHSDVEVSEDVDIVESDASEERAESSSDTESAVAGDGADSGEADDVDAARDDASDDGGDGHGDEHDDDHGDEGDIAADYLEELLDIADIDGDIEIEERGGRTYISILNEDGSNRELENLVGRNGEVLEALQELTRLSALAGTDKRSRIILDIAGHRVDRSSKLRGVAEEAVEKVKSSGGSVSLKPMSAYERKVVHDAVADLGFHSESEGEGSNRHVVVSAQ